MEVISYKSIKSGKFIYQVLPVLLWNKNLFKALKCKSKINILNLWTADSKIQFQLSYLPSTLCFFSWKLRDSNKKNAPSQISMDEQTFIKDPKYVIFEHHIKLLLNNIYCLTKSCCEETRLHVSFSIFMSKNKKGMCTTYEDGGSWICSYFDLLIKFFTRPNFFGILGILKLLSSKS